MPLGCKSLVDERELMAEAIAPGTGPGVGPSSAGFFKQKDLHMFGKVRESGQGVPPGIYKAEFATVDPVPENKKLGYNPAFKFSFKVVEDSSGAKTHAGASATRVPSGASPTTKNGLGKFLAELTGVPLAPGVDYDAEISKCFGKHYTIVVKQGEKGGTRVDTVMPLK